MQVEGFAILVLRIISLAVLGIVPCLAMGPRPSATQAPSTTNITVSATSAGINSPSYEGTWTEVKSSCPSVEPTSVQCRGSGNTMLFSFFGTGIYMTVGQNENSGIYSVRFGNVLTFPDPTSSQAVQLDGFSTSPGCKLSWYISGLPYSQYQIQVDSHGVSPLAPSSSQGTFELVNLIYEVTTSTSGVKGGSMSPWIVNDAMKSLVFCGVALETILFMIF